MKSSIASALAFALLLERASPSRKTSRKRQTAHLRLGRSRQISPKPHSPVNRKTVQPDKPQPGKSTQPQTGQAGQPLPGPVRSRWLDSGQAYQAELKRCSNASDRKKCVDEVNKKFGQMLDRPLQKGGAAGPAFLLCMASAVQFLHLAVQVSPTRTRSAG